MPTSVPTTLKSWAMEPSLVIVRVPDASMAAGVTANSVSDTATGAAVAADPWGRSVATATASAAVSMNATRATSRAVIAAGLRDSRVTGYLRRGSWATRRCDTPAPHVGGASATYAGTPTQGRGLPPLSVGPWSHSDESRWAAGQACRGRCRGTPAASAACRYHAASESTDSWAFRPLGLGSTHNSTSSKGSG